MWMMGGCGVHREHENKAASFSMLNRWSRAEGAIAVFNGWPPAEPISSSGERPFVYGRDGESARVYGWRRVSLLKTLCISGS
jgi:hypothetical protein